MMISRVRAALTASGSALLLFTALAACGSDDATPTNPPTTSASAPSASITSTAATPAPYDPGPRADLPDDLATVAGGRALRIDQPLQVHGETVTLTGRVRPTGVEAGDVRIRAGSTAPAVVGAGWEPVLYRTPISATPVRVGSVYDVESTYGVVVSQEGGDSDSWSVYARVPAGLTPVRVIGPDPLGAGFLGKREHYAAYRSWVTPRGLIYTAYGLPQAHHFRVVSWRLESTDLLPDEIGVVCFTDDMTDYGRC